MSQDQSKIVTRGTCHCKALSWTSTAFPTNAHCCWCRTCRRQSGAPFTPYGEIRTSKISFEPASSLVSTKSKKVAPTSAFTFANPSSGSSGRPGSGADEAAAAAQHQYPHAILACSECHQMLALRYANSREITHVVLGTIWCPDALCCPQNLKKMDLSIKAHVFLADKVAWFEVPRDGAERYLAGSSEMDEREEKVRREGEKEGRRGRR